MGGIVDGCRYLSIDSVMLQSRDRALPGQHPRPAQGESGRTPRELILARCRIEPERVPRTIVLNTNIKSTNADGEAARCK